MTTTAPAIANSLQALPNKAIALAAPGQDTAQEYFSVTLEQELRQDASAPTVHLSRPGTKLANLTHSKLPNASPDLADSPSALKISDTVGAEPNLALAQSSAAAHPMDTLLPMRAGAAQPQPELLRAVMRAAGPEAESLGAKAAREHADAAQAAQNFSAGSANGQAQAGITLDKLDALITPADTPHRDEDALNNALKQLESAKALLSGAPTAQLEIDEAAPPAPSQLNALQGPAATPQTGIATAQQDQTATLARETGSSANMASNPAEALGAPNTPAEATAALDATLFSAETMAARAPDMTPLPALASLLVRKLESGGGHIAVRLDPPELGRLDITLGFGDDGAVTAHIRADRPEALELMQREAKGLEQSLRQAGFTLDGNALSFSLNQGSRGQDGDNAGAPERYRKTGSFRGVEPDGPVQHLEIHLQSNRALDLRV